MALFEGSIYSNELSMNTGIAVSLPNDACKRPEQGFPVLFLLHGLSDDHTAWVRRTNIDRYAQERGLAVVMPEVQRSYYTDMEYGLRYFSYVSEELPRLCREMFGLSARREDCFAAGISMGGYGALKCVLRRPDRFSACAGISGAVDIKKRAEDYRNRPEMRCAFGNPAVLNERDDLFVLAKGFSAAPEQCPKIFLCCGTEDSMLTENRQFKKYLEECGIRHEFHESPGKHDWAYWESVLPQVLDFFLKGRNEEVR